MGNQSLATLDTSLEQFIQRRRRCHSNNSIDLLDDIYGDEEDDFDVGQAIQIQNGHKDKVVYWLLPFNIYL